MDLSTSDSPPPQSTPKKAARNLGRELAHAGEDHSENSDCDSDSGASEPPPVIDLSSNEGRQEGEQGQVDAEQGDGWTLVGRNGRAARHQNPPRPKFKLGSLGDHETAYQAIKTLEEEYPALRMEVRPNLKAEYVLTPKDKASATFLRRLAEEGNRVFLLDPNLRRHKVVLQRYPLDLPLDAVRNYANVLSATRL